MNCVTSGSSGRALVFGIVIIDVVAILARHDGAGNRTRLGRVWETSVSTVGATCVSADSNSEGIRYMTSFHMTGYIPFMLR